MQIADHIPKFINSISVDAFDGCSNLERVVFDGCIDQWNELACGAFDDERSAPRTTTVSNDLKKVKKAEIVCLSEVQTLDDALVLDEWKKLFSIAKDPTLEKCLFQVQLSASSLKLLQVAGILNLSSFLILWLKSVVIPERRSTDDPWFP